MAPVVDWMLNRASCKGAKQQAAKQQAAKQQSSKAASRGG
jgi:hypothetical protein